jgi:DNA invertase Pin-like site-specific DNA recombinase
MAGRDELKSILEFVRTGDTLMVTGIDRLARSVADLQDIVRTLRAKGASLKAIEQPIDTSTAAGKAFLDMLSVFAEFETALRRERQLEGIAKAEAEGRYKKGRPRKPEIQKRAQELRAQGMRPAARRGRAGGAGGVVTARAGRKRRPRARRAAGHCARRGAARRCCRPRGRCARRAGSAIPVRGERAPQ